MTGPERAVRVPSGDRSQEDSRYQIRSLAKGFDLLAAMERLDGPVSLADLVRELGWSKALVYRLLRTLETRGVVRRVGQSSYVLGVTLVTLGHAALRELKVPEVARLHVEHLHQQLGETVNVCMLDGAEVAYVGRLEGRHILDARIRVGSRLPLYCTASGHVLLAGLDDQEARKILSHESFSPRAPHTLTSLEAVVERIARVRASGYAINDEELVAGHRAAAAPVRDYSGATMAAIDVSVTAARVSLEDLERRIVPLLLSTADAVTRDLSGGLSPAAIA